MRDMEWGNSSVIKDLLRKQEFLSLICISNVTIRPGINKNDFVSAHIQLSAAIDSVSTGKDTSGSKSRVSSSEANEDRVLQEAGSDTSDDDNIPLAKLASSSWVIVIAMYH